jgi:hypothetical protein
MRSNKNPREGDRIQTSKFDNKKKLDNKIFDPPLSKATAQRNPLTPYVRLPVIRRSSKLWWDAKAGSP